MKHCGNPRLVIWMIGVALILGVVGALMLSLMGRPVPGEFWAIMAGLGGNLGSILSSTNRQETQAVEVVNAPSSPVPVEESA